jgi:hypothetical protein
VERFAAVMCAKVFKEKASDLASRVWGGGDLSLQCASRQEEKSSFEFGFGFGFGERFVIAVCTLVEKIRCRALR